MDPIERKGEQLQVQVDANMRRIEWSKQRERERTTNDDERKYAANYCLSASTKLGRVPV